MGANVLEYSGHSPLHSREEKNVQRVMQMFHYLQRLRVKFLFLQRYRPKLHLLLVLGLNNLATAHLLLLQYLGYQAFVDRIFS